MTVLWRSLVGLAVPVFVAACGGIDFSQTDLSFFDLGSPRDGDSSSDMGANTGDMALVCGGATIYQVRPGPYRVTSAALLSDTCMLGITTNDFMGSRQVDNDSMGNITVLTDSGNIVIGKGMVSCNKGTLTSTTMGADSSACAFTQTANIPTTVTAANQLTIEATYTRNYTSIAGMICTRPATCTIRYIQSLAL